MDNSPTVGDRRGGPRQTVSSPIYVHLSPSAGGFLCDLSEGGLAVDVFGRITRNQIVRLAFDLPDADYRIEAMAQISWINELVGRTGLKFVDMSEALAQQIREWISVQDASRTHAGTQSGPEETVGSCTSSTQVLAGYEHLAELRAALSQVRRLPKPKRGEQIIHWLRMPVSNQLMEFRLSLVLIVGTLLMVAYVFTQQRPQVHTAQATNGEPARPGEHLGASVTAGPGASNSSSLNPSGIPRGAILLQVAALTREREALALAETLEKKYSAFVRRSSADDYYHVQVGPYLDAASARSARHRLEKDGFNPIVKR